MKPALSIVFFTVASGAGLGVLALSSFCALFDLSWLSSSALPRVGAGGLALALAGLASSTLHLANPRNAWRSFTRFRTSWLSREAVFALALIAVSVIFIALVANDVGGAARRMLAILTIALSWAVMFCTAMIYAGLKPIRQWHTWWTPAAYLVLGHWSAALIVLGVARHDAVSSLRLVQLCLALGALAALAKWGYWRASRNTVRARTIEQAIGVAQGVRPPRAAGGPTVMQARLLDAGHTGRTFLTDEFGFRLARRHRAWLLALFWVAGIAVPLLWIVAAWAHAPIAVAVCAVALIGILAERWLFFADARHTVRLYHGDART